MTDTDRELVARLRDWPRDPAEAATWVGAQAQMREAAARIEALASDRDAWKARAEAAELRLVEAERLPPVTDTDRELVARLRELARAASPGPWETFHGSLPNSRPGIECPSQNLTIVIYGNEDDDCGVHGETPEQAQANAAYIAAANPKAITELCDDRDAWKARAEAAERERDALALRGYQVPQKDCDHAGWSFKKDGRCCPKCGAFVVDFGD